MTNINEVLKARCMGPDMVIEETLNERGKRYGDFDKHALITQSIKLIMQGRSSLEQIQLETNWDKMSFDKREALEMIAHKIGRILNGDPNYKDSWVDIAGYAQLVANSLTDD